jgi:hypothetical protein
MTLNRKMIAKAANITKKIIEKSISPSGWEASLTVVRP